MGDSAGQLFRLHVLLFSFLLVSVFVLRILFPFFFPLPASLLLRRLLLLPLFQLELSGARFLSLLLASLPSDPSAAGPGLFSYPSCLPATRSLSPSATSSQLALWPVYLKYVLLRLWHLVKPIGSID